MASSKLSKINYNFFSKVFELLYEMEGNNIFAVPVSVRMKFELSKGLNILEMKKIRKQIFIFWGYIHFDEAKINSWIIWTFLHRCRRIIEIYYRNIFKYFDELVMNFRKIWLFFFFLSSLNKKIDFFRCPFYIHRVDK